jgi:hypothetical protein
MGKMLSVALDQIQLSRMATELEGLLTHTVTWHGRSLSIEGYEGMVTFETFVEKYFKADALDPYRSASLEERLACNRVWEQLNQLRQSGDPYEEGSAMRYLSQSIDWVCTYLPCFPSSLADISSLTSEKKARIFYFTPVDFEQHWTQDESAELTSDQSEFINLTLYVMKKEQVEQALENQKAKKQA